MFLIQTLQQSGFNIIALEDSSTGTQVQVIPQNSAMLHGFSIMHRGQPLNIIDSFSNADDYRDNFAASFKGAKMSPFACRITGGRYTWQQQEYAIQKAIVPGRVIHGLLYDRPFTVTAQQAGAEGASLTLQHRYGGDDPGYPFAYTCEVQYRLQPGQRLSVTTTITSNSSKAMPLMDGWHPYFSTGTPVNEMELRFAAQQIVEFNAQLVPTGRLLPFNDFAQPVKLAGRELDNSFMLDFTQPAPLCTLRDPLKKVAIDFYPDAGYPVLQIYIPPHRNSIAIEHLTAPPDAFNNGMGLIALQPGESRAFSIDIAARHY